jgi:hypothetical protein
LREIPAIETPRQVWIQNYTWIDHGTLCWRFDDETPPAGQFISSPYDKDARYSHKRGMTRIGYKVHLSERCHADLPHLITNVETTTATTANEPDNLFRPLATGYDRETIALADQGFGEKDTPTQIIKYCVRNLERALYDRNEPQLGDRAVSCQEVVSSRQGASGSPLMVTGRADLLSAAAHRAQTLAR